MKKKELHKYSAFQSNFLIPTRSNVTISILILILFIVYMYLNTGDTRRTTPLLSLLLIFPTFIGSFLSAIFRTGGGGLEGFSLIIPTFLLSFTLCFLMSYIFTCLVLKIFSHILHRLRHK